MSLILNIDTASENAHVGLAKDGQVLQVLTNELQKEHASFLQTAIQQLTKTAGIHIKEVDAIAVTAGPGSYTGLRVGFASAKGLCYALKKPFITIGSLDILTVSALLLYPFTPEENLLFCPMIDARRMEVYTAIYHRDLRVHIQPCAMILNAVSFEKELLDNKIVFFGSGSDKWQKICIHPNALFKSVSVLPQSLATTSYSLFSEKKFTDLAYSEPFYLKEFQSVI
ncbi:MAG: tRNA (adenosine(37)-N6)-threonylcarbamoyltransferase complex dimerization subunit type 1 TsaB [Ferruginibacter sp.]